MNPRRFRVCLPRIAHGRTEDQNLQSTIQVQNLRPHDEGVNVQIDFFDSAGEPLFLSLNGKEESRFEFHLDFLESQQLTTDGPADMLVAGYALIESDYPVTAQTIFQVLDDQRVLVSEAGVQASMGRTVHVSPVQKTVSAAIDTGIAVTNVGVNETYVRLVPFEEGGGIPEEIRNFIRVLLPPGGHHALFLSELCQQTPESQGEYCRSDFLAGKDFRGSLEIASTEPTVATTIRTVAGMPVSSLPVGSTEE